MNKIMVIMKEIMVMRETHILPISLVSGLGATPTILLRTPTLLRTHTPPPMPHVPPPHHHIPIFEHKEVKVIIVPPKPVPQIPICKGKIKDVCCDSKDYCPWNWWYYPEKEPPKICKVEVEVVKELKLCQWPVLVWKDEFDFTCKCPETPEPCQYCDSCYSDNSGYSGSSAGAYASSGSGGYAG